MSLWDRLQLGWGQWRRARDGEEAQEEDDREGASGNRGEVETGGGARGAIPEAPEPDGELARLARVGEDEGPAVTEAIAILRRVRGTVREAEAVRFAMHAMGRRKVPDPVRVACADILATRGDEDHAMRLLEGVASVDGLVLLADLFAAKGQIPRAVGAIERVLAREIDAPGARERHARWVAVLGGSAARPRRSEEATIMAASPARGPFRLLREVARGGAGAVYEAEDELLGRRVAYKVYHGRGADRDAVAREARISAALAGPGVIRVYDASPTEGWVALEWIPRGSVRDLLKLGEIAPFARVEGWARSLAHALARVHAAGYVHADVKPANVLLRQPGEAVLGDFGIARRAGVPGEGGSPGYVSPERIAGRASDPRDDIYGYGRVLEDVLHRLEQAGGEAASDVDRFRETMIRCLGPDEQRPRDAMDLLRSLPY